MKTQLLTLASLLLGVVLAISASPDGEGPGAKGAIRDKTLVAWVSPANLAQRGGSVLTLESRSPRGQFDAIVLGEIQPATWMAGSEFLRRTQREQKGWPAETATADTTIQLAVVYRGRSVSIFRNGQPCTSYAFDGEPSIFTPPSVVLLGLRHLDAGGDRFFFGTVDDARVYDTALDAATIASLKPNAPAKSDPQPLGWWHFEDGKAEDAMKTFPPGRLVGEAKIEGGKLHLNGGYLVIGIDAPREPASRGRVVFEDCFEGRLGDGWTWLREDPGAWRLREGALEIKVEPGVADTVKNALLRKAPDRSKAAYAVEVTVANTVVPTQQYEQAGITWYSSGRPVFKLVKELVDGQLMIIPGRTPMASEKVELRLVVKADGFVAQFRPEGKGEFLTAATGQLPPPQEDQVSVQCYNGPPYAEHWIRFDDFRIVELGD